MSCEERDPPQSWSAALSVCVRCRPPGWVGANEERPGAKLAEAIEKAARAGAPLVMRRIYCMSQCKRPCVVAFTGEDRFTYVFGDLSPAVDATTVLACFDLYRARADGFMERWERPEVMRDGVLGRIPPLGSTHKFMISEHNIGASAEASLHPTEPVGSDI